MDPEEILAAYDQQQRVAYEYPDMRKEILPHVTRHLRPAPGLSLILHSRLDKSNADQVIQEQIADFTQLKLPFTWKVYRHDQPPDLGERLAAAGFEPDSDPPDAIMVLDLQETPGSLLGSNPIQVRKLTQPDELEDVIRVEQQVWGGNFDWIRARMGSHLAVPGYLSVFVAYQAGQPACTGWTYYNLKGQFAGLWGGSTVPGHRRRGLYTALVATRAQEARRRGMRFLTLDASPMSQPITEKLGFRCISYAHEHRWRARHTPT